MAERNLGTIRECDRADCRRRKGVLQVEAVITVMPGEEAQIFKHSGELCPAHRTMALKQAKGWFLNKKIY